MSDPFLQLSRPARRDPVREVVSSGLAHHVRAHSKFSASGAERWFNCPGSVALSEGLPDKSSPWALEGTQAHEVLETVMTRAIAAGATRVADNYVDQTTPWEMQRHAIHAANFVLGLHARTPDSEVLVETRIYLDFIHPEMFGTFDGAVIDFFGTLHVFDYKYGAGHFVSPTENLQMIFYAIGLAHRFHWNFKRIRVWIIQPRVKGYDGPLFWEVSTPELKSYVDVFRAKVARVEESPGIYVEGSWCHWCKAKSICPLKREAKLAAAKSIFTIAPISKVDSTYRKRRITKENRKWQKP